MSYGSSTEVQVPSSVTMTLGVVVGIPVTLSICVLGSAILAMLLLIGIMTPFHRVCYNTL